MVNPIDKVIARKTAVEKVNKEIRRRRRISKKTRGKTRKRKQKNKGKKRKKKKVVTTTQTKQPPIKLSDKDTKALLQVNITAKERRKKRKKGKSFAEKRAQEIAKTGIADPAILKQAEKTGAGGISQASLDASILKAQQKVASEVLGYTTQTRDPLTLRAGLRRYNQDGGVGGFGNVSNRYDTRDPQQGIRTGLQSQAVKSTQTDNELQEQREARRRRQPSFRGGGGGGGGDDDDDDDKPPTPKPQPEPDPEPQTKRTPKPQPEPEPESNIRMSVRDRTPTPQTTKRRTPPESYFAGRLAPDTPLRFRPLSQPVPPATPLSDVDDEITGITGGKPPPPATPLQPVGTPQRPQYPDAPTTPEGLDASGREEFFTPTLTGSEVLPPEEPLPRPTQGRPIPTRSIRPDIGVSRRSPTGDDPIVEPPEITSSQAFRPVSRAKKDVKFKEPIQSVRRGRGRPKGSKNKPRADTPFVLEETGEAIDRAELKFELLRIQSILKRRLGSWRAKEVDDVQSLQELNEAVASITDDEETAELIRLYWQIRLQLGQLKKL